MTRRNATDEERELFRKSFAEAAPIHAHVLKPAAGPAKPASAGETGLDGRTAERLKRGTLEPDARIDLHGMTEAVAHDALLKFLRNAQRRGTKLALVVTGKGIAQDTDAPFDMELHQRSRGVLKSSVPRWLNERDFAGLIAATRPAHKRHGGEGALYVYLRKGR
ncbi:MAG: Smr/MutS family protein [Proteobacteria bacterium]|nr:Smr/MutS family protein [Pseudomonadota bacterium]